MPSRRDETRDGRKKRLRREPPEARPNKWARNKAWAAKPQQQAEARPGQQSHNNGQKQDLGSRRRNNRLKQDLTTQAIIID